jgi:2'-5' RNA ligase
MTRMILLLSLVHMLTLPSVGQEGVDSSRAERVSPDRQMEKGNLFSAVSFATTALGGRWAELLPEAGKLFPALKMKAVSDLHVTVIYIGKDWTVENLDQLRKAMAVHFTDTMRLTPEIATLGRNNQVVAVELKGIPEAFQAQVVAVKAKLNADGLKRPEAYDSSFRAHVTLAESKENPPTEQRRRELEAFRDWITLRLDLPSLQVLLEPAMPIRLMLAGATRPTPVPEYITVDSYLENAR